MSIPSPMPHLVVERLSLAHLRLAFPLMRRAVPELTPQSWIRYARGMVGKGGHATKGILVVRRDGSGCYCGAVCFRRVPDIRLGAVLLAEHFVAMDLLYPEIILRALLGALDDMAASLRCGGVRSMAYGSDPYLANQLATLGHVSGGTFLARALTSGQA